MKYYLIAGEPSGDLHGSNLIKGLLKADPEARLRFWGGDLMAAAGGEANLAKHYRETSFFGIVQVLKNLRTIKRQMRECRADVAAFAPDVLILVDYPGFNIKMARWAKEHGIRTFYYIAPKVWAWREWRVKAIRRYVDRLFIIFPFERTYFPKHGITPVFEGNPLVDAIEARRTTLPTPEEFRRRNSLDQRPIVALLAGSRRNEIRDNLPLMAALSRKFPERQFVVAGVAWLDRALYEQYTDGSGIRYVCDQTYETLAAAEAAVVTSGTATLETALLGIPEVVVYRTVWWQVWLRPYVLKVPWVSLVNLNLGREAVAEIIQSDFSVDRAERELRAILRGGSKRGKMLADFGELKTIIGGPGASERFAARMVAEHKIASDERPARSSARRSICNRMRPAGQTVPDADLGLQHPAEGETQKRRHRRSFVVHATTPGDNRRFIDFIYNNTRTDRPTGGFFHNPRCLPAGLRDLDGGPGTALRPQ